MQVGVFVFAYGFNGKYSGRSAGMSKFFIGLCQRFIKLRKLESIAANFDLKIITEDDKSYSVAFKTQNIIFVIQLIAQKAEMRMDDAYEILFQENAKLKEGKVYFS